MSKQVSPADLLATRLPIRPQMTSRTRMERKAVDDVLGGDEMWKHADATDGACLAHGLVCRSRRPQRCATSATIGGRISISCRSGLQMNP